MILGRLIKTVCNNFGSIYPRQKSALKNSKGLFKWRPLQYDCYEQELIENEQYKTARSAKYINNFDALNEI